MEEVNIKCVDCEKIILQMVKTKDSENILYLIVSCPFCEGESWSTRLEGRHYQKTVKGTKIDDLVVVDNENILIKVIKDAR
jgi:hypothetical protein